MCIVLYCISFNLFDLLYMCPFCLIGKKKLSSYIVSDIWYVLHLKPWRETAVHMARLTWNRADRDEELNMWESEYIYVYRTKVLLGLDIGQCLDNWKCAMICILYYYNINFMIYFTCFLACVLKYTYTKISYNFGINLNLLWTFQLFNSMTIYLLTSVSSSYILYKIFYKFL